MTTIFFTPGHSRAQTLPLEISGGSLSFKFQAGAGLYQFSVIADAREFDWDELYVELNAFNNDGQRTGPWDFNPVQGHYPLVPSYWVYLDGKKIGLWFFARVSLEDLEAKRFRGRMAFWLCEGGDDTGHELQFVPYRPFQLNWASARLESDPEDRLLPPVQATFNSPPQFTRWHEAAFWAEKRNQLQTTHAVYAKPLHDAFEAAMHHKNDLAGAPRLEMTAPNEWIVLLAAYRLENRREALDALIGAVDELLALPHWGNPREDGYSHNGDMHAAFPMRAMAWVYHGIGEELGEERRRRMREKLVLQGERFVDLCLLNRDYWGGSLLQDHGWRSIHTFTAAALCLLNVLPQAREWLRYFLPRAQRALHAMPRDGVVPESSHHSLSLYLNDIADLREAWLAWNGEDIFNAHPFHAVVDFVVAVHTQMAMVGGNAFFNQIAHKYADGRAAWIAQRLLQQPESGWQTFSQRQGFYAGLVRGFLTHTPDMTVQEPGVSASLHYFSDSGRVYFLSPEHEIAFQVTCAPVAGYHAYRHATGPCDRAGSAPGAGHFAIRRGNTALLATPDAGYALQSAIRSCLLIDGRGQHGDIGYPMSIPSKLHRGEEIESVRWDETTRTGTVRLHLAPAYPDEAGVAHYTREFVIAPRQITVRDHVVLNEPKNLSWLFQGKRETGVALEGELGARFGGSNGVALQARPLGFELQSAIHPTPVVWSYSSASGFKPFDHVRFDSVQPLRYAVAEFVIRY